MVDGYVPRFAAIALAVVLAGGAMTASAASEASSSSASASSAAAAESFSFHRDHVLGTSLELTVVCPERRHAEAADAAAMLRIEQLRLIFSTYDPESELSRLNSTRSPLRVSPELLAVLDACAAWQSKSGGAFNAQLGQVIALWKAAEQAGLPPSDAMLRQAVAGINKPAWTIDRAAGTVMRTSDASLNLDALAKGYIIDQALEAARKAEPAVKGLLLDIGGDLATWGVAPPPTPGRPGWRIGVADPRRPEDNAAPLMQIVLSGQAVATSGLDARPYVIAGKHYGHILDPRTGRPTGHVRSATAVAADAATADALATALCVLPVKEGLALVEATAGAACLIVDAAGTLHRGGAFAALEAPAHIEATPTATQPASDGAGAAASGGNAWPLNYQVGINLTIATPPAGRKKPQRPYVAVWVENEKGQIVRTVSVWGDATKYLKELRKWWSLAGRDAALVKAVTRASRAPGRYRLVWDGKDDKGRPLPQGTYHVCVEAAREGGSRVTMRGPIKCLAAKAVGSIAGNAEISAVDMSFAPRENQP